MCLYLPLIRKWLWFSVKLGGMFPDDPTHLIKSKCSGMIDSSARHSRGILDGREGLAARSRRNQAQLVLAGFGFGGGLSGECVLTILVFGLFQIGPNGYYFAIDPNGYVLLHPNLQPKVLKPYLYLNGLKGKRNTKKRYFKEPTVLPIYFYCTNTKANEWVPPLLGYQDSSKYLLMCFAEDRKSYRLTWHVNKWWPNLNYWVNYLFKYDVSGSLGTVAYIEWFNIIILALTCIWFSLWFVMCCAYDYLSLFILNHLSKSSLSISVYMCCIFMCHYAYTHLQCVRFRAFKSEYATYLLWHEWKLSASGVP